MAAVTPTTAVGVFRDRNQIQRVVDELRRAGFRDVDIAVTVEPNDTLPPPGGEETLKAQSEAGCALLGNVIGIAAGLIWAALPAWPAFWSIEALVLILMCAIAGRLIGGVLGSRLRLGYRQKEAQEYQENLQRGRLIVTVHAGERYDEAIAIMRQHGGRGKDSPLV